MSVRRPAATAVLTLLIAIPVGVQVAGVATHAQLVDALAVTWDDLAAGEVWRLATNPLVQDADGVPWAILALLPLVPAAEWRLGTARTLAVFFGADLISTLPVLAVVHPGTPNGGSSAGLAGLAGALVATAPPSRRRDRAALALAAVLVAAAVVDWELAAVQHLVGALAGAAIGRARLTGRVPRARGRRARPAA